VHPLPGPALTGAPCLLSDCAAAAKLSAKDAEIARMKQERQDEVR
jgi:hypothetical protein